MLLIVPLFAFHRGGEIFIHENSDIKSTLPQRTSHELVVLLLTKYNYGKQCFLKSC